MDLTTQCHPDHPAFEKMSGYRKNAVVIDFGVVPTRPKIDKVRDFVFQQMCLDISRIKSLQTKMTNGQVLIETDSAELAEQLISEHHLKHKLTIDGKSYLIPVQSIDNTREVRIYDLPPQMPNKMIETHFSTYGQVTSIKDETWKEHFPGVLTGTRIIRMKLRKHIPSYVEVAGETSYVSYKGQIRTCKHCVRPLHMGKSCVEARKESGESVNKRLTLAEVVQSTSPPIVEPTLVPDATIPVEPMEIEEPQKENTTVPELPATVPELPATVPELPITVPQPTKETDPAKTGQNNLPDPQVAGSSSMLIPQQPDLAMFSTYPGFTTPKSTKPAQDVDTPAKRPGSPNLEGTNQRRTRTDST